MEASILIYESIKIPRGSTNLVCTLKQVVEVDMKSMREFSVVEENFKGNK
jgi:hypothetical protein